MMPALLMSTSRRENWDLIWVEAVAIDDWDDMSTSMWESVALGWRDWIAEMAVIALDAERLPNMT